MRKQEVVVVPSTDPGRDAGKHYLITEMSASQAEKWALRAFLALKGSDGRIPENIEGMGMVGVAILGMNVFLQSPMKPEDLMPLLDEMMTCVQIIRDPRHPDVATPLVSEDDIAEVKTRLWLRSEVLRIHTNFSPADALSTFLDTIRKHQSSLQST